MLQILPSDAGAHPGLDGRLAIASFAGSLDVVYPDALVGQVVERGRCFSRHLALRHTESRGAGSARLGRPGKEGNPDMDLTGATWRKSTYSGGTCVEVAVLPGSKEGSDYVIALRDSKNPEGPALIFTPDEWTAFTAGVLDGEFDLA